MGLRRETETSAPGAFRIFGQDGTGELAACWLAGGVGPQEAVEFGSDSGVPHDELRAVAEKYSDVGPLSRPGNRNEYRFPGGLYHFGGAG